MNSKVCVYIFSVCKKNNIYILQACILSYYMQYDIRVALIKMLFSVHWENMVCMPEQQGTVKINGR